MKYPNWPVDYYGTEEEIEHTRIAVEVNGHALNHLNRSRACRKSYEEWMEKSWPLFSSPKKPKVKTWYDDHMKTELGKEEWRVAMENGHSRGSFGRSHSRYRSHEEWKKAKGDFFSSPRPPRETGWRENYKETGAYENLVLKAISLKYSRRQVALVLQCAKNVANFEKRYHELFSQLNQEYVIESRWDDCIGNLWETLGLCEELELLQNTDFEGSRDSIVSDIIKRTRDNEFGRRYAKLRELLEDPEFLWDLMYFDCLAAPINPHRRA